MTTGSYLGDIKRGQISVFYVLIVVHIVFLSFLLYVDFILLAMFEVLIL